MKSTGSDAINSIRKVGVIGAGRMGVDVSLLFAVQGFQVILNDVKADALKVAKEELKNSFRTMQFLLPNCKHLTYEGVLGNIIFANDYTPFDQVDLIIENVTEDWEIKKKLYTELAPVCGDVFYGVNTSCISITKIASLLPNPEKVIGMHFMNPATIKDVVELIPGYHTSQKTIQDIKQLLKQIGRSAVIASDMPGFIANRLSHLLMNEAAFLVQDGVASPKEIDLLFRKGYGHAMGPLETADLIGLDTVVHSLDVLYESYKDTKFRCCPLLRKMVSAGLTGRRSGAGFHRYNNL